MLSGRQKSDASAAAPTSSVRSCCKADFYLHFCKELLMWPSTDPQQMLDRHGLTSGFHPDDQRTQSSVGLDLHTGVVPAWTNGTDL